MSEHEDENGRESASAVWFNKRQVVRVDFQVDHQLTARNDGFHVSFQAKGALVFDIVNGPKATFTVAPDDVLVASGEDFYLSCASAGAGRKAREEKAAARDQARAERAEQKSRPAKPSARRPAKGAR